VILSGFSSAVYCTN